MNVYLELTANGEKIEGESTVITAGGEDTENTIECLSYRDHAESAFQRGLPTGVVSMEPIRIVKRIDKSTPLLFKAMDLSEHLEGKFKFFRTSPADGITEFFLTVTGAQGRVAFINRTSPATAFETANVPMTELRSG
jgi:type VI secretion system secreted protein Hcp